MNRRWATAVAMGVSLWLVGASGQGTVPPPPPYKPGEVLVQFKSDASSAQQAAVMTAEQALRIRRFQALNIERVQLRSSQSVTAALAAFAGHPQVAAVQPNYERHAIGTAPPNDPLWLNDTLWGLKKIQADTAWTDYTTGDDTVVIANIDTGVNYDAPRSGREHVAQSRARFRATAWTTTPTGTWTTCTASTRPTTTATRWTTTATARTRRARSRRWATTASAWWASRGSRRSSRASSSAPAGSGFDSDAIECFNYVIGMKSRGVNVRVTSNSWGSPRRRSASRRRCSTRSTRWARPASSASSPRATPGVEQRRHAARPGEHSGGQHRLGRLVEQRRTSGRASATTGATSADLAAPGEGIASTYGSGYGGAVGHEHGDAACGGCGGADHGRGAGDVRRGDQGRAARQRGSCCRHGRAWSVQAGG